MTAIFEDSKIKAEFQIFNHIVVVQSLLPLTRHCGSKPERGYELGLEDFVISRQRFADPERIGE